MTRPRLRASDKPLPLRLALGLYRASASLRLAVVLISILVIVLAWATILESAHFYGHQSRAVHYGIYGTWWFAALNVMLACNVFCAALTRFPWKRRHTGFLVTHAGILVLLLGCLLTYRGGVDAHLAVFEGDATWRAYQDAQDLQLTINPPEGMPPASQSDSDPVPRKITIPFVAGPFNWADYDRKFPFPWCLARRDRGVVYDRDGIRLEALDYYSDSEEIPVPQLTLRVNSGRGAGRPLSDDPGELVRLVIKPGRDPRGPHRQELPGGQRIVFWPAASAAETHAFRDSRPQHPLGPQGQLVLHAGGRKFHFSVESLQQQPRQPLGDTGWEVELVQFIPQMLGVQLQLHHGDDPPRRMILLADFPELNRHDRENGLFGSYWFDAGQQAAEDGQHPGKGSMLVAARRPRIDVLQSEDEKLYYRTWHAPKIGRIAPWPADGTEVLAFAGTDHAVALDVEEFLPSRKPGTRMRPVAFKRDKSPALKQPQVRLRLTVDGHREEFWLAGLASAVPDASMLPPEYRKTVSGKGRRVAVTMPRNEIDVGFQVYLHQFRRQLDPGSHMVSHYSSLVDFCDREDKDRRLRSNVLITLNAPVNFSDPRGGRSYRLYQSSFVGPFRPGDPQFRQLVGGKRMRDRLFQSVLSVNYDPGRGVKYTGCLMICVGISIMFYMKAYFFRKRDGKQVS